MAAYTFEIGTDFFQECNYFESTLLPANLPALIYAAKVVRTPYLTPCRPRCADRMAAQRQRGARRRSP